MTTIVDRFELDFAATGGQAGTITEPSIASSGKRIIMTGNWFCSRSTTGGKTWTFMGFWGHSVLMQHLSLQPNCHKASRGILIFKIAVISSL